MRSRAAAERFIRLLASSKTYRPDGAVESTSDLAVWTLAHRGYSGNERLDVWAYPTKDLALRAGAVLAMQSGLDEDAAASSAFAAGHWQQVMERYEQQSPRWHVLRVQAAFLQDDDSDLYESQQSDSGTVDDPATTDRSGSTRNGGSTRTDRTHLDVRPVGLAEPMRRAVIAALEGAGWPVEVEHHPQAGALRTYAGPATIDVARAAVPPAALVDDVHPDDAAAFDLSSPLQVRVWAPMFVNFTPELGRIAGIDAYQIGTDRTAEQIVTEIDTAVSVARRRDMTDSPAHAQCGICGDHYPDRALLSPTDDAVPVCPCCAFDGDLLDAEPAYLAYQLDQANRQSVALPAGWSAVQVLLCCLAGSDFESRLRLDWRAHGTLFEPAEVWSNPTSTWIWLPPPPNRPPALRGLGCGASLAAVMSAIDRSHPDLLESYRAARSQHIAEDDPFKDDEGPLCSGGDQGPREPQEIVERFWPAVIAYAVALLTQQHERRDSRPPWHVLESFELVDWIENLDPQLNSMHVETVLLAGITTVRDLLDPAADS